MFLWLSNLSRTYKRDMCTWICRFYVRAEHERERERISLVLGTAQPETHRPLLFTLTHRRPLNLVRACAGGGEGGRGGDCYFPWLCGRRDAWRDRETERQAARKKENGDATRGSFGIQLRRAQLARTSPKRSCANCPEPDAPRHAAWSIGFLSCSTSRRARV